MKARNFDHFPGTDGNTDDQTVGSSCDLGSKNKIDCGYPGISREECENTGCCFDDTIHNVIWCFIKYSAGN